MGKGGGMRPNTKTTRKDHLSLGASYELANFEKYWPNRMKTTFVPLKHRLTLSKLVLFMILILVLPSFFNLPFITVYFQYCQS